MNFSVKEDFSTVFRTQLTNILVDARANIKQQTWTVGPSQELKRTSVNFGQIFDFSFAKRRRPATEEEETYLELTLKIWKKNSKTFVYIFSV